MPWVPMRAMNWASPISPARNRYRPHCPLPPALRSARYFRWLWRHWPAPEAVLIPLVSASSVGFLALLGAVAARAGGASALIGAWRVTFWGALAMAITAGVGMLFGGTA